MFRLSALLLSVMLIAALGVVGVIRATQPPLPPLIYTYNADLLNPAPALYSFAPNCPDWWTRCADRTRARLEDLHATYPVISWSPDGAFIVARARDARWLFYRADCLLTRIDCLPTTIDGAWSDLRLAWGVDGSVIALPSQTGTELRIFTRGCWDGSSPDACAEWTAAITDPLTSGFQLTMPDWSADGRWLAFSEGITGALVWLRAACLDAPATCYEQFGDRIDFRGTAYWLTLSADGATAIYFSNENPVMSRSQIYLYNHVTGDKRRLSRAGEEAAVFDWSADERYLAYSVASGTDFDLMLLDMVRGVRVRAIRAPGWSLYPAWGVPSR
ncbi:MAG: hypothetical protein SGI73_03015 [Chloroflexota bacterium]|nr:hypothetical protein [Chloroflexota bacterium]